MTIRRAACALILVLAACGGPAELRPGDCVEITADAATSRLESVACDSGAGTEVYRVVWVEEAADAQPLTVTLLAAECEGPTLLPDADMMAAGDRTVVCFEPIE